MSENAAIRTCLALSIHWHCSFQIFIVSFSAFHRRILVKVLRVHVTLDGHCWLFCGATLWFFFNRLLLLFHFRIWSFKLIVALVIFLEHSHHATDRIIDLLNESTGLLLTRCVLTCDPHAFVLKFYRLICIYGHIITKVVQFGRSKVFRHLYLVLISAEIKEVDILFNIRFFMIKPLLLLLMQLIFADKALVE